MQYSVQRHESLLPFLQYDHCIPFMLSLQAARELEAAEKARKEARREAKRKAEEEAQKEAEAGSKTPGAASSKTKGSPKAPAADAGKSGKDSKINKDSKDAGRQTTSMQHLNLCMSNTSCRQKRQGQQNRQKQ